MLGTTSHETSGERSPPQATRPAIPGQTGRADAPCPSCTDPLHTSEPLGQQLQFSVEMSVLDTSISLKLYPRSFTHMVIFKCQENK